MNRVFLLYTDHFGYTGSPLAPALSTRATKLKGSTSFSLHSASRDSHEEQIVGWSSLDSFMALGPK